MGKVTRSKIRVAVIVDKTTQRLPHCPHAIHLRVVDPERRITWGGEEITTRIATNGVVNATVGANFNRVRDSLRHMAELVDVGLHKKGQQGRVVGIARVHGAAEIALETTRVIPQAAHGAGRGIRETTDRAEVDRHVGKRTGGHKPTPHSRGKGDIPPTHPRWGHNDGPVMWDVLAVAAEAVSIAIEHGRVLRSGGILGPVPVGLVSRVAAFLTQRLFILEGEPAMPRLEDAGKMNRQRLLDVHDGEVVKSRLGAWRDGGGCSRRFALQTFYRVDVGEPFLFGERATG